MYVFLHHLNPLAGTPFEPLLKFGQEAVLLFFLVSGFVIAYSQLGSRTPKSPSAFLVHRAIRIYPIFLASIVLAALAAMASGDAGCINAKDLIGNLLMLQDIGFLKSGTWVEPFCSNSPLWSLSYEWWFYAAFALLFASDRWSMKLRRTFVATAAILGSVLSLLYPAQPLLFASYFSLWWAGLELCLEYMQRKETSFQGQKFSLFLIFACATVWAIPVVRALLLHEPLVLGREPFLQLRHFGAGFIFVAIAIVASRTMLAPKGLIRVFSLVAPLSYGLYASHQPVISLVRMLIPGGGEGLVLMATVSGAFFVAYLLEIIIQPRIAEWFSGPKPTTTVPK